MQPSYYLALAASLLPTLISATACVAGGPSYQVNQAHSCCNNVSGTWYQFYPVQAICVFDESKGWAYTKCINAIQDSLIDSTCIPGSGPTGPTGPGAASSATPRTTITAPARRY